MVLTKMALDGSSRSDGYFNDFEAVGNDKHTIRSAADLNDWGESMLSDSAILKRLSQESCL